MPPPYIGGTVNNNLSAYFPQRSKSPGRLAGGSGVQRMKLVKVAGSFGGRP